MSNGRIQFVELGDAVSEIYQSCSALADSGQKKSPYFFMVGAGISVPEVPTASNIVDLCRVKIKELGRTEPDIQKLTPMQAYSMYLKKAFPSRSMRRDFFKGLIEGKSISRANLRLAHLLLAEGDGPRLANLAVTTNFDNFLSRALSLFGRQHISCDHPATTGRLEMSRFDQIEIIHLHGSYLHYDTQNLDDEIDSAAKPSASTTSTVAGTLDAILKQQVPLVIGYSGWENDAFMCALRRRLHSNTLPHNLYWFCRDRRNATLLPEWLLDHGDVQFVASPERSQHGVASDARDAEERNRDVPAKMTGRDAQYLDAVDVFEALILTFHVPSPEITIDPLGVLLSRMEREIGTKLVGSGEIDIYNFEGAINKLRMALDHQKRIETNVSATDSHPSIEMFFDAVKRSDYAGALQFLSLELWQELDAPRRKSLLSLLADISARDITETAVKAADWFTRFFDESGAGNQNPVALCAVLNSSARRLFGLAHYEDSIAATDQLLRRFGEATEPVLREQVAMAMFNKCITLDQLKRHEEELATYDQLLARFGEATEPALRKQVAMAMFNKGITLSQLERHEEGIAAYDQLLARFGEATESALRERVAKAMVNKGFTLGQLKRQEEGLAVYDQLLARFGDAIEPALQEQVANAMFNKGNTLGQLERREEGLAVYDQLLARFGEAVEPALREQVAMTLVNKGNTLGQLERREEGLAVYDQLLARFGEAVESALQEQVAKAIFNKGLTLSQLKRQEEGVAVYDQLLARFGEAVEPALREQVAMTLVNKGNALSQLKRHEEEIATYDQLLTRFGEATEPALREQVAKALLNKGITLGQLERYEEGVVVYDQLLARFGEATEPALREQVAKAMVNKGITLSQLERYEEGVAVYDQFLARFGEATEPALREHVAKAMVNKGFTLNQLKRQEEGITVYDQLLARFGEAIEPALQEQVAMAMFNKGITLGQLERHEEGIAVYDQLLARFGEAVEPALREQVAMAMFNKGITLGQLERHEEEIVIYDQLLARFGEAVEPALREQVAMTMVNKGITLGQLDCHEEEIAVYDQLLARFGEATEPAVLVRVAKALLNKGITLGQLERREEEIAVYDHLLARFGETTESALREQVSLAHNGIGFALLLCAKREWIKASARNQLLADAQSHFLAALEEKPDDAIALGNAAYTYFLNGQSEQSRALLLRALTLGGEPLYIGTERDTQTYSVPEDLAFRELLDAVWAECRTQQTPSPNDQSRAA